MDPLFHLAERRIDEAVRSGAFDRLPGQGRPLQLDDLSMVPEELRASWILLKSHGFVPPELEARKEWLRLRDLVDLCSDAHERGELATQERRALLRWRLLMERSGLGQGSLDYREPLLHRLAR